MTTEELEVRVWAFVVMTLALILFGSVAMILYAVTFVEQSMGEIAEIDKQYLSILKDIMLLCIGAIGGIAGRKGAYAAANLTKKGDKDDSNTCSV
jgi:energy-converting hydrogenase Eha subunit H